MIVIIVGLGDSITEGLGVKSRSYGDIFVNLMNKNSQYINMAGSAMQISESIEKCRNIPNNAELIFIMHGITEAIIRPKDSSIKKLPRRWRKAGWLDPRPYYSKNILKSIWQRLESSVRWRIKKALISFDKGTVWMNGTDFNDRLTILIETLLLNNEKSNIVFISHCGIDEKYFPKSLQSLDMYKEIIKNKCELNNNVYFCDISNLLNKWEDFFQDHFHPNGQGHIKIATFLYEFCIDNEILALQRKELVN